MKKLFSIIAVFLLGALTYTANQYGILDAGSAVALAMAVPAAVGGTYSEQFISLQGMNLREFYPTLVRKFGTQGVEFFGDLVALGWTQEKAVQRIEHWEDDWIWDNFKVMAQAGGGATATLTIDPDSIDADGNFYPQVSDIIEFPVKDSLGNYIQAYITAIGATTIDVRVLRTGWTIPATSNNQQLFVVTNYSAEGTGQPASKVRYFNLYQNDFAIIKTKVDMTGSEMTDSFWFKTPDGVVSLASMELDYRQLAAEQNAALSGVVPQSVTQSGKPVKGTKGLFPTMNQESIQMPYTTWGMSNFDIMNKALSRVYAGNITGHYYGLDLYTANENMLTDFFKHTNVDYVTRTANKTLFGEADGDLAATVMFSYIEKSKRVHAFKMIDALNNPKTYGSDGFDYQRRGFSFPMKNDNLDVKSKAKVPSICAVYRKKDGYSRVKEMFTTGSANAAKYGNTDDVDVRALNCRTEMGMEFFAANQFLNIKPA